MIATATSKALGTGITVGVTDETVLGEAAAIVEHELACIDLACSRFRADSELTHLNRNAGHWVKVSPLLLAALEGALRAAALSEGLVDPTIGKALIVAGYDEDFEQVPRDGPDLALEAKPSSRYREVRLDTETNRAWIPDDVALDLGSTAKAFAADRAASAIVSATGQGALVSCGGDLSICGPVPDDGWLVQVSEHHADADGDGETIAVTEGGLATSGTLARRWRRGERELHHIIDPRTGLPAQTPWKLVTVAAGTCVDANIASTAAIVMGDTADTWLEKQGLAARLVHTDGTIVRVGGWPA